MRQNPFFHGHKRRVGSEILSTSLIHPGGSMEGRRQASCVRTPGAEVSWLKWKDQQRMERSFMYVYVFHPTWQVQKC